MRHRKVSERLGRNFSLRKATIRDLAKSVLVYQSIVTTTAKAKASRKMVDRLISLGKDGSLAAKRRAFSILCDHNLVKILFSEIAPRYKNRLGGYTRIFALLQRRGDNASQSLLELTEKIVKEKKARAEKSKKEEVGPVAEEMVAERPMAEEKPVTPPKPKLESKPAAKKEKPKERSKEKSIEKPQPKEVEKPKEAEKPKEEKPKRGLLGGFGKIFKRRKDIKNLK
ncbi:MAG: 50S ribosomal protein L17 [Candidatus Omnitrophota bacterium]|nr:50S ribosomal protein L17 [Candidatus Omnitrophota bacterium]